MGPMVSLIKRLHCTCIKDRQCGPNGVLNKEATLYIVYVMLETLE